MFKIEFYFQETVICQQCFQASDFVATDQMQQILGMRLTLRIWAHVECCLNKQFRELNLAT